MTLAIKVYLVIVEDSANLLLASLNIHFFYKEEVALTLPASPNRLALSLSTPAPNNCAYNEFVLMAVKNEAAYIVAAEVKES